jgi:hypothetical protein
VSGVVFLFGNGFWAIGNFVSIDDAEATRDAKGGAEGY